MNAPFQSSNLPVELVRDIFEHAAHSDRTTARHLALVSSAVRHWTDPILYYTVILSTTRSLRAFGDALSSKPSDFFRTRVHNLGIFVLGPIQSIHRILSACTGAQNVACSFPLPARQLATNSTVLQGLTYPREQHLLGVTCRSGWDPSLIKSTVTRLRIHLPSFDSSNPGCPFAFSDNLEQKDWGWDRLGTLPALTHLAVVYRPTGAVPPVDIIPHLAGLLSNDLGGLPMLQLILVQIVGARKDASFASEAVTALNAAAVSASGRALRIVAEHAPPSVSCQWEVDVRGGKSVWEHAEAVVKSRLAAASNCR